MEFQQIIDKFNIPDKTAITGTTSLKLKQDVYNFFYPQSKDQTIVEFGSFRGHFTQLFSEMFNQVYSIDWVTNKYYDENCNDIENVTKYIHDLYRSDILSLNLRDIDVIVIDAVHMYNAVRVDTYSAYKILKPKGYLIYDDYGAFKEVKHSVDTLVRENIIKIVKPIGESKGYTYRAGKVLNDHEGLIAQFVSK